MFGRNKNRAAAPEAPAQAGARIATASQAPAEPSERASNLGVGLFSCVVFALVFALACGGACLALGRFSLGALAAAALLGLLASMSVHIAQEWERVVVLRFGAFNRVSGPGLFWTIPFVEQNTTRIDMRLRASTFDAEKTLTSDLVPLNVDAVLFWVVFDPKAACLEVSDFSAAVRLAAQTSLRQAIGRLNAAQVAIKREQLDRQIKDALEEQTTAWGVSVLSVEVRDILLPDELQDAMSAEAQAEQRLKARMALAEGEPAIAEILAEAAAAYEESEDALRLRSMHLLFESIRETGSTVVVPSSFAEGLGDVLPDAAKKTLLGG